MAKICFVSYDILGPVRNGGIGTAMTAAAEALAAGGDEVTILCPSSYVEDRSLSYWTLSFAGRGIAFRSLFSDEAPLANSYLVYQWLKTNSFDVVHFHDWRGAGYWPCIAKRQNLAFRDTTLVCQVHGQTYWHLTSSSAFLSEISDLELDFIERRAVELADAVFSPSAYMLDWMRGRDWRIPEDAFVCPNLLPEGFDTAAPVGATPPGGRAPVDEVVFFGRLETRKGVELFCEAVSLALGSGAPIRRVTFLGKEGRCGSEPAMAVIARAAAGWPVPYAILNDHDLFAARGYLAGPGRLAVIASVIENSPYTVLEGLASGLPFIAADVGGVAELIAPEDREDVLFAHDPRALAARLARCATTGALVARPAIGIAEARRRWLEWHGTLAPRPEAPGPGPGPRPGPVAAAALPLVSVCISHFARPHLLRMAVESIEAQTYPNLQVVLLDDASPDEATKAYLDAIEPGFRERGWKIVRNETEVWTGAARNLAVSHADGEYVLLMDDDNVARPEEVATFVTAALATGADVLTCQQQPFVGTGAPPGERAELPIGWMALGPHLSQAVFQNCLGDLNMMVRRSVWERLGGFTTDLYGCEDWEFLVKAILEGHHLEVVPEMLFFYRHSEAGLGYRYGPDALYKSNLRPLRPVLERLRPDLQMALRLAVETRHEGVRRNHEGYWRPRDGPDPTGMRIARLPLNTGEALVEMARAALGRGQVESAILLYGQALRNAPSNRSALLEAAVRWGGDLSTTALAGFLAEPAVHDDPEALAVFIGRARLLEERGEDAVLVRLLEPACLRHPENRTLRTMLDLAARRLGEVLPGEVLPGEAPPGNVAQTGPADSAQSPVQDPAQDPASDPDANGIDGLDELDADPLARLIVAAARDRDVLEVGFRGTVGLELAAGMLAGGARSARILTDARPADATGRLARVARRLGAHESVQRYLDRFPPAGAAEPWQPIWTESVGRDWLIQANLYERDLRNKIGGADLLVALSSSFHAFEILQFLERIAHLTDDLVVFDTTVVEPFERMVGGDRVSFTRDDIWFAGDMSDAQTAAMAGYWADRGVALGQFDGRFDGHGGHLTRRRAVEAGLSGVWWWFLGHGGLDTLLAMAGLAVVERVSLWDGRSVGVLARKVSGRGAPSAAESRP